MRGFRGPRQLIVTNATSFRTDRASVLRWAAKD
jgi:hypothetical protein